jgi:RNA polymerase sigma factor (sigma-70 family)
MIAAANGRLDICELLLHEGADVSICDPEGRTAFDLATSFGHHGLAAKLRPKVVDEEDPLDAAPNGGSDEDVFEGWEAEEEFLAPDSKVTDEDAVALQRAIAAHRVARDLDEWDSAEIALPSATSEGSRVPLPQSVRDLIASGLAAGWLTDTDIVVAWPRATRSQLRQLRLLCAAANIRVFPARPGNPFQSIRKAEPRRSDFESCDDIVEALGEAIAWVPDTVEKYKQEISGFQPFSAEREARIFTRLADAKARLVDAFSRFQMEIPITFVDEPLLTEDPDDAEEAEEDDEISAISETLVTETDDGGLASSEPFLRDFVRSFELLERQFTDKNELEVVRLALENYRRARDRAMEGALKLVPWLANRYRRRGLPLEDLIQEGNIGLMRAVEKFDSSKGARFGTYASYWIRQSMLRAIEDQSRLIRVPVHLSELVRKTERFRQQVNTGQGREPSVDETATALEVSPKRIRNVLAIPRAPFLSVSRMKVDETITPADQIYELVVLRRLFGELLLTLAARTELVIRLRFGMGGMEEHTLEEVGEKFDVTRERIRQIEAKGLRQLKHPSRSRFLGAFRDRT